MTSNNHGVDWDGELQALMESSGIDPREATRPNRAQRWARRARTAKPALGAVAVTVPGMWFVAGSGAPTAAVVPLIIWAIGWIAYGIWISLGRPDWSITAAAFGKVAVASGRAGSRFAHARTRPLRARWRTVRARVTADAPAAGEA
ncbi:hypothetical protein [Nocardia brasiliensis]|uniref:hypothetical protein n=1 Tax=Nocardia brasiliensis TaxID=37326 RepID=UPI003D94C214